MKWSEHTHPSPLEPTRPPESGWWRGWLQLLCVWIAFVLVCAHVGLALAHQMPGSGLPSDTAQNTQ